VCEKAGLEDERVRITTRRSLGIIENVTITFQ
jgi:hypothetical protein